mmetsp:Transcript_39928/g.105497  ORF Transcript_39928/g.105497 Transcript_39928/m.105497 type:complete len:323 (+) Transcript_39928:329-1297(+)
MPKGRARLSIPCRRARALGRSSSERHVEIDPTQPFPAPRRRDTLDSPDNIVEEARELIAYEQGEGAAERLNGQQDEAKSLLVDRSAQVEHVVDDCEVGDLDDVAAGRAQDLIEPERLAQPQDRTAHAAELLWVEFCKRVAHLVVARDEGGHAVPWARDEPKELWARVEKIDNLRHKEEEEGLRVVPEDCGDRERHACKVAERVADKHLRRVPVVAHQRERDAKEGENEVEREEVVVVERPFGPAVDLDHVVDEDRQCDHNSLPRLEAIDSREDVDRVGAKDGEACHEEIVQETELERGAKEWCQELGHDNQRAATLDGVHHQ